ncbi:MAG: ABC transporter transmembrane domain-containing protein [Desulfuromonadales bacterium]|nr:ABC transporter transmembrane domain-containing protein [Desulfuromonadales bacterium]
MGPFKRLVLYSKPYWLRLVISALGAAGVGGMNGLFALLVAPLFNGLNPKKELVGPLLNGMYFEKKTFIFIIVPFGIIILFTIRGICRYLNEYFVRTAGQLAIQNIRNDIYQKNMGLSIGFFNRQSTGVLMSRVLNDVNAMQDGVSNMITGFFRDGFSVFSLLFVLFYRNWELAIISFLVLPAAVYPAQLIGKKIKKLSKMGQAKMGDISTVLQETFSGVKVIKAFGLEQREIKKFRERNLEFYGYMRRSIKYDVLSTPLMEVITSFGFAAVLCFGGSSLLSGKMTIGEFLSFFTAMALFYDPVKRLVSSYNVLQRSMGAAERVFELMDQKPEIVDSVDSLPMMRAEGNVTLQNVSFKYDHDMVLNNISLEAKKGEIIALVGPSGGGKTTLVSLISRFYDVTGGAILLDGIDIRKLKIGDLLKQIALVDQETILFNDTIANNIRYGNTTATDDQVEKAAKAAYAHDFILDMPAGYLTNIGDRGVRISGGQRQRLCIARAILKNAPVLILDEATSALDTESEQMVQNALNNLMENRTTFVIAHRLSTILHADKIIVLENGRIVEMGKHSELLSLGGVYSKLHSMQFN